MFDELVNKRMFEINKLGEGIDFNSLTDPYKGKRAPKYFVRLKKCPLIIYNYIKNGRISLLKEGKLQEEIQLELNQILKGNLDYK